MAGSLTLNIGKFLKLFVLKSGFTTMQVGTVTVYLSL